MIEKGPLYYQLKQGFKSGIGCRISFDKYCEKRLPKIGTPKVDSKQIDEAVISYTRDAVKNYGKAYLLIVRDPRKWITECAQKTKKTTLIYEADKDLIADTFRKGLEDPCTCYQAWYEACYEHLVPVVLKLAGENTPIGAIIKEVGKITSLLTDKSTANVITEMDKKMKKLYPDYKQRMDEIRTDYCLKLDRLIDKAVARIVNNRSAEADLPK